ncbi:MAG: hypothetical protein WCB51_07900 [Candidatus Dormiibacterota bacterium]
MDADNPGRGSYLRRAEALIEERRDLFGPLPRQSMSAPSAAQSHDRAAGSSRPPVRQLRLPLPRERGRLRARMLR